MTASTPEIVTFSQMMPGQFGDTFVLLSSKEESRTRDDKPFFKISFRDSERSAVAMIWSDHALFHECKAWAVGAFFKLRCRYTENSFGSQVDVDRIRPVNDSDYEQGFGPDDFYARTRYDVDEMFDELVNIVEEQVEEEPVQQLVLSILQEHAAVIKHHSAAMRNHHAFIGGYLEHTLSVTRTAVFLADKYTTYYTKMSPALSKSLVIAGAVLHDIGKLEELRFVSTGWEYTPRGRLVGHILLGRDLVIRKAEEIEGLDPETILRIEHMIISHQNLPEWGSPIAPHTPEALLVHYADDMDAKFHELAVQLERPWPAEAEFTPRTNPLRRGIFIGLGQPATTADSEE